jgi:hypothetical protein
MVSEAAPKVGSLGSSSGVVKKDPGLAQGRPILAPLADAMLPSRKSMRTSTLVPGVRRAGRASKIADDSASSTEVAMLGNSLDPTNPPASVLFYSAHLPEQRAVPVLGRSASAEPLTSANEEIAKVVILSIGKYSGGGRLLPPRTRGFLRSAGHYFSRPSSVSNPAQGLRPEEMACASRGSLGLPIPA